MIGFMRRGVSLPAHTIVYPVAVGSTTSVPSPGVVAPKAINPVTISGTVVPSPTVVAPKIIVASVVVSATVVPGPVVSYPQTVSASIVPTATVVHSPTVAHSARSVGSLAWSTLDLRVRTPAGLRRP